MSPPAGGISAVAERFGRNFFLARRRSGLSQERLVVRSALHRTEIGLLENDRRVARVDTLMKLAASLEVGPADLLDGFEWSPVETGESRGSRWFVRQTTAQVRY